MRYTYCSKCHEKVSLDQVKYNIDAKLVCLACLKGGQTQGTRQPKPEKQTDSKVSKYICTRCRYNFKIKEGSNIHQRCPYCGSTDVLLNHYTVDDLIQDSTSSKYDR